MPVIKVFIVWFLLIILAGCNTPQAVGSPEPEAPGPEFLDKTVIGLHSKSVHRFVNNYQVYSQGWDTLAQAVFWQKIFSLSHDSMIVNIAALRKPLITVSSESWHCQSEEEKNIYKRNICISNNIEPASSLFVTSGKKFFFEFRKALPMISEAIPVFEQEGTDPWYAQTILLIESPGKSHAVSYVGARGPFQLMPYVARKQGLIVSKTRDDRTDLAKSARAAAQFIGTVCLPYARKILNEHSIQFDEKDLWFRFFTMHIYHAGAGNVAAVMRKISPASGGMELIRTMWQTEAAGFKNESQNYSQLALAAIISFDKLISQDKDTVYLVEGDKMMQFFRDPSKVCVDTLAYLINCRSAYENDLVDGMIPFDYFERAIDQVIAEERKYHKASQNTGYSEMAHSERFFKLGNELMHKRKFDEAIQVFRKGLAFNPVSPAAYDSLGRAYRLLGNNEMALKYTRYSKDVIQNPESFLK